MAVSVYESSCINLWPCVKPYKSKRVCVRIVVYVCGRGVEVLNERKALQRSLAP